MNILRRLYRGCRYSEKYGSHPGTLILLFLLLLGFIAGGGVGLSIMSACFVPIYLIGAWERGKL